MAKMFNRSTVVAVTSTQILGPNPRRSGIVISPPSANRISLSFGEAAVLDTGITMMPDSTPLYLTKDNCGIDLTGVVNAIASVQTSLSFTEICNP